MRGYFLSFVGLGWGLGYLVYKGFGGMGLGGLRNYLDFVILRGREE